MITMEDRWDEFNKRYPDTDYRAMKDARAWQSDEEYIRSHLQRINMQSDRFYFSIKPTTPIYGLNDVIQETYMSVRSVSDEAKALEKAFRVHDITIHVAGNLLDDLSEENILEWLDWKGVVYYYSSGHKLFLPSGLFNDHDWTKANAAIEAVERLQPRCPTCDAPGWRSETNNLGQTVYWCDSWMCSSRFTSDAEN